LPYQGVSETYAAPWTGIEFRCALNSASEGSRVALSVEVSSVGLIFLTRPVSIAVEPTPMMPIESSGESFTQLATRSFAPAKASTAASPYFRYRRSASAPARTT
jgi:hypothetical protein